MTHLLSWVKWLGSTTRKSRRSTRFRLPSFESLEKRVVPTTIFWLNPAGGNWDTASNWMGGVVPGAGDDAVINVAGNVTIAHSNNTTDNVQSVTASDPITLSAGTLSVAGSFSDSSTVTLAGGTLANATVPAGTILSTSPATTNTFQNVTLSGTLNLSAGFLVTGTGLALAGGTINGGTITTVGSAVVSDSPAAGGTLSGVTLAGTMDLFQGRSATITNGLTLSNGLIDLSNSDSLMFAGTEMLGGTGAVEFTDNVFNGTSLQETGTNGVLTVGAGVTIETLPGLGATAALGTISATGNNSSIVFNGTVSAAASGATLLINGSDTGGIWTNHGAIESVSGGTLELGQPTTTNTWSNTGTITATGSTVELGGTFTTAGLGTFNRSGGTVYLTGTLNNTDATLALNNTTGSWQLYNGTINGGAVTTAGSAVLSDAPATSNFGAAGCNLNGVTLAGTLNLLAGRSATITNGLTLNNGVINMSNDDILAFAGTQTLGGTGAVVFGDINECAIDVTGSDNLLTIGPNIFVHGNTGEISGGTSSFINYGTVTADAGQGEILLDGNFTNAGAVSAVNGSTVDLGPINFHGSAGTFTNSGTITGVTGFIFISETLNNVGSALALTAATGPIYLVGGTILGGTITTTGGAAITGATDGGTLSGVTLAGTLDLTSPAFISANLTITGGLTLNQGSINLAGGRTLKFTGTQNLGGTGTVTLDNTDPLNANDFVVPSTGDTVTIMPGITIQGNSGTVGSSGAGLITNKGTIEATGGGTLTVQGFTNFANGTLTGGAWEAVGNSTLRLVSAAIVTNGADILLDGAGSNIFTGSVGTTSALAGFITNLASGSFTIQNGASFSSSGAFSNAGTLTINSGSTFIIGGTSVYTQTGGTTILQSGTLGIAGNQVNIQGGILSGPGTINGSLTNGGAVDLGNSPGTLIVNGNYSQTAAGALALKVGGAMAGSLFDRVDVTGAAALNGTLNVSLSNGFAPGLEEVFDVLNFAGSSGSFATFNSPLISGAPAFVTSATPTSVDLVGATTGPDLAVSNVAFTPAQALLGQNVTVTYTATNLGTVATTAGTWTDSLYLSTSTVADASAMLLGRVTHTGDLGSQKQYAGSLTAILPGATVGNYHVIVVIDSGLSAPDINRANNVAVAATALPVTAPLLTLGTPVTGTIANSQDLYYQLDLASAADVQITASYALADEANLYVRYGAIPDSSHFDQTATNPATAGAALTLAQPQGGVYYILVQGLQPAGSGQSFTLGANILGFTIGGVTPNRGSNSGQATITVVGSDFTPQTVIQLHSAGGTVRAASSVQLRTDTTLFATVNLVGLSPGTYDVQATDHNQTLTDPAAFTVVSGNPGLLHVSLSTAAAIRVNQLGTTVTLSYANTGATDIPAPLLTIQATNAVLSFPGQAYNSGATIQILAIDQNGPAGILPPGYHGAISLPFRPETPTASMTFQVFLPATPDTPIDWSAMQSSAQPSTVTASAWNGIWANFTTAAGPTVGTYQTYLDGLATYLGQFGEATADVQQLYSYALALANSSVLGATLTTSQDAGFPAPGVALTFDRAFPDSVSGRNVLGPFGYGWTDNWDMSASTDAGGNVTIHEGNLLAFFLRQSDGSYDASVGDTDRLTLAGGIYQLRQTDGTVTAFPMNGPFVYVQDANGNRITAGYTGNQLTSLTDSSGAALTIAYNGQGRISSITDPAGRVATYSYDTSGDYLLSVTSTAGMTQYTYSTNTSPPVANALVSVAYPTGAQLDWSYDSQGRLATYQYTGGADLITYQYGFGGAATAIDATGASTTSFFNAFDEPSVIVNGLGQTTRLYYDNLGHLLHIIQPNGATYSYSFSAQGSLLSQTDPLGNTNSFTYDADNNLTSNTDPNCNTTDYSYDAGNDLLSITYANGVQQSYTYNPLGEVTQFLDARGQAIGYTYNAQGLVTMESFTGGATYAFTYDADGNLTSATDAQGHVTSFTHGGQNDGDPTNPDLLSEVSYPDGTFLKFTYNAGGQRTQSIDQTGFTLNYTYDAVGRLSELTDGNGNLIVEYTYNTAGELIQKDMGNGTRTTYSYGANRNLLTIVNLAPEHVTINSFDDYTYDSQGNVLTDTNQDGAWTYSYDADSRLTQAVFVRNSSDPDGLAAQNIQYVYDGAGNRLSQTVNDVMTTYAVNNLNQVTSSTTAGVGTTTYQFDADGNLIATAAPGGNTTTNTFNSLNQLTAVNGPGMAATYFYDPLGNLVSQTSNGATTNYQIDPIELGNVVASFNGTGVYNNSGGLMAHYTYGHGLTSQVAASGAAAYYAFDMTGNTVGITNASGSYVNRYAYMPFGATTTIGASLPNSFTYVGQFGVLSTANGLEYMRERIYSPAQGRFLSMDPLGLGGGQTNVYAYVAGNPLTLIDPSGLSPVGGAIGGVYGTTVGGFVGGPNGGALGGALGSYMGDVLSQSPYDMYNNLGLPSKPDPENPNSVVGSSRVDLQACKLEYSIVSPK